jgi:hypothetical protein
MRPTKKLAVPLSLAVIVAASFAITNGELFTWAEAVYASLFTGQPTVGQYQQYDYRSFSTGNYLAVDDANSIGRMLRRMAATARAPWQACSYKTLASRLRLLRRSLHFERRRTHPACPWRVALATSTSSWSPT